MHYEAKLKLQGIVLGFLLALFVAGAVWVNIAAAQPSTRSTGDGPTLTLEGCTCTCTLDEEDWNETD